MAGEERALPRPAHEKGYFSNMKCHFLSGSVALLMSTLALPACAQFETFFDTDGETIGVVENLAAVGFNTLDPITVFANSGTNVGNSLLVRNNSTLRMSGGTVGESVVSFNNSVIHLTGGDIGKHIEADPGGTVHVYGGNVVEDAIAFGTLNIYGGAIGEDLTVHAGGVANLYGGQIANVLFPQGTGVINVFGTDLLLTEVRQLPLGGREFLLTGTLRDGTSLNNTVLFFRGGQVVLNSVPEPGSVALLCGMGTVGGGLLFRRRRRKLDLLRTEKKHDQFR
jgi:hypothetical protein